MCNTGGAEAYSPELKPQRSVEVVDLRMGELTKSLRIRESGIRVGCTFITKEAVEYIIQEWNDRKMYFEE